MAAKTSGDMVAHTGRLCAMVCSLRKSPFYQHFVKKKMKKPFKAQND